MTRISLSLSAFSLIQLLLTFTISGVTADPLHIPVHRKRSAPRDVHYYAAAADRVRAKYGFPTSDSSKKRNGASISARFGKRASSAGISITDQVGLLYFLWQNGSFTIDVICRTTTQVILLHYPSGHREFILLQRFIRHPDRIICACLPPRCAAVCSCYSCRFLS